MQSVARAPRTPTHQENKQDQQNHVPRVPTCMSPTRCFLLHTETMGVHPKAGTGKPPSEVAAQWAATILAHHMMLHQGRSSGIASSAPSCAPASASTRERFAGRPAAAAAARAATALSDAADRAAA